MQKNVCIICQQSDAGGIRVLNNTICGRCERRIAEMQVGDSDYDLIVGRIRRMWQRICEEQSQTAPESHP